MHDAFDRAAVAIEWLDRFPDAAPGDRLDIIIDFAPEGARRLELRPFGDRAQALANALAAAAAG